MYGKRLTIALLSTIAVVIPLVLVMAPPVHAAVTQVRMPIAFTLSSCPNLAVSVFGTGETFLVINSRTDRNGVTHIEENDLATGTATDSNGGTYRFNYHSHTSLEIPPSGFPYSVMVTDHFNLNGTGQANQLHVGFVLRATFTSPSDPPILEFVNVRGDPFSCDPI